MSNLHFLLFLTLISFPNYFLIFPVCHHEGRNYTEMGPNAIICNCTFAGSHLPLDPLIFITAQQQKAPQSVDWSFPRKILTNIHKWDDRAWHLPPSVNDDGYPWMPLHPHIAHSLPHLTSKAFFIPRATAEAALCATEDKLNREQVSYAEAKGLRCWGPAANVSARKHLPYACLLLLLCN